MSTAKATAARSYARIAGLPLRIDGYELAGAERAPTAGYTRLTTVVTLLGRGHEGQGEDTTYATPNQPKRHSRTSPRPAPSTSSISRASQYEPSGAIAVAADAELYRRVLRAFPDAWIEDPGQAADTTPILDPHRHPNTWDAPSRCSAPDPLQRGHRPPFPAETHDQHEALVRRVCPGVPRRLRPVRRRAHPHRRGRPVRAGAGPPAGPAARLDVQPGRPNDVGPTEFNEPVLRGGLRSTPLPAHLPTTGSDHPDFRTPNKETP